MLYLRDSLGDSVTAHSLCLYHVDTLKSKPFWGAPQRGPRMQTSTSEVPSQRGGRYLRGSVPAEVDIASVAGMVVPYRCDD